MTTEPEIKALSYQRRERFFWMLVVIFLIALPSLIFYTTGYRLSFEDEETSIVTTGGMYVTTDNLEIDVFLDEEQVERPRLFRSAYYIQNISEGQHRIVVQRPDLQTWVKVLPVYPHIVTEVAAFNMPLEPHVRPITQYETATGTQVYFVGTSTERVLTKATSTVPYILATSSATTTFQLNEEYTYVSSLFSTTSTSSRSVFERFMENVERFRFATSTPAESATTSTSTEVERVIRGDIELLTQGSELYAKWVGDSSRIPYYFCVSSSSATSTALKYGDHVQTAIESIRTGTSTELIIEANRVCRPEIKLDRLRQDVYYYDFFPNSRDLVLLHLENGVYVTEIDDRAWQNTQPLYPGDDLSVVVENDVIYVFEDGRYFELITEIEPPE